MKFKKILQKSQKELKKSIKREWRGYGYEVISGDGWLYKKGAFPVLLVAHMDTVHKEKPTTICRSKDGKVLSSPQGIGGDDRCGIYMIQEIIKKYDCACLLTEDEEIGCIGASKFAKSDLAKELKGKFVYIIEFDRRGSNDAVFYNLDNLEFEDFITKEYWETAWGTCSDICDIAPALDCAAVNFSCGYYDEHTIKETIHMDEMQRNISETCKLLARTDEEKRFEWKELEYPYGWGSSKNIWSSTSYKSKYYDDEWIITYIDAHGNLEYEIEYAESDYEAIGMFLVNHDDMTYSQIQGVDLYDDYEYWNFGS